MPHERKLRKLGRLFSWYNRGNALANPVRDLFTIGALLALVLNDYLPEKVSPVLVISLTLIAIIGLVITGMADSKVGFRRYQNEYEFGEELMPPLEEIAKDVKEIKNKLKI